jgi:hypothetical protein
MDLNLIGIEIEGTINCRWTTRVAASTCHSSLASCSFFEMVNRAPAYISLVYFPPTLMPRLFSVSHIPLPIINQFLSGYTIRHALASFGVTNLVILSFLANGERKKAALIWLRRKISCLAQGGWKQTSLRWLREMSSLAGIMGRSGHSTGALRLVLSTRTGVLAQ